MANTYSKHYIHTTFPVKYRKAIIKPEWQDKLFGVIGNLINETGCQTIIVNGVEDHVHCLFGHKPSLSISDVMKTVKAKSSKWVNESGYLSHRFEWQAGFGSFTYGHSQIDDLVKYIKNQKEHHKRLTFMEEYILFIKKFEVNYDERYLFTDLT